MKYNKKITIAIPCYNEEKNIPILMNRLMPIVDNLQYDVEIIFTDNCSSDGTVDVIKEYAKQDKRIKMIVNQRNYGVDGRSGKNSLQYFKGDAVIGLASDCQDPPELIPELIRYWEDGYKIVAGQKNGSDEGRFKYKMRSIYYRIIQSLSNTPQYKHLSGIVLYDKEIKEELLKIDHDYYFRFAVADMGYEIKLIPYRQEERPYGKSSYNSLRYLSFAIQSLVTTSSAPLRLMTIMGLVTGFISFSVGLVYLILKLVYWKMFQAGSAPILIGLFFIGSILMFSIGMLGEYIAVILRKVTHQPDVKVKETINFDEK